MSFQVGRSDDKEIYSHANGMDFGAAVGGVSMQSVQTMPKKEKTQDVSLGGFIIALK